MSRDGSALARGFAALIALSGALAAAEAWRSMPLGTPDEPGPGLMPLALGALAFGLGLAAAAVGEAPRPATLAPARALLAAAILVVWPLALPRLGFALTTAVALLLLARVVGEARWPRVALFAAVTTTAAVLLFRVLLRVPLPVGPWGF
jgi:putative tricarboxylic transport membrane protein